MKPRGTMCWWLVVLPEEARRHFVIGNTLQKAAKAPADAELAVPEYQQALLIALGGVTRISIWARRGRGRVEAGGAGE